MTDAIKKFLTNGWSGYLRVLGLAVWIGWTFQGFSAKMDFLSYRVGAMESDIADYNEESKKWREHHDDNFPPKWLVDKVTVLERTLNRRHDGNNNVNS